jgi:deoxyribodipyrimidine photo-lyase
VRTLVWFRGKELRVDDHAPLRAAVDGGELVCAFVVDPYFFAPARARELPHRMQFLLESIAALAGELERRGSRLLLVRGKSVDVVPRLVRRWRVDRVVAQRWTEPFGRVRDDRIAQAIDVPFDLFDGETLAPPETLRNAKGKPFSVYSAFARAHRRSIAVPTPRRCPRQLPPPPRDVREPRHGEHLPTLADLGIGRNPLLPRGGETAAKKRLAHAVRRMARYDVERDRLDLDATSRLSVDLKFGTLSARTVWTTMERALATKHPRAWRRFEGELLWREFTHAVLWDHPDLLERPHRPEFAAFPWEKSAKGWRAWCEGTTGYPIVDASARQLLAEGFVHNRARMISASFLTKDLRIDFRRGEAHYLKYLVDGDWAQNDFGWQWTTGCGFDAAPYFRVFNPIHQGQVFDPTGDYVRRWVPELARLPAAWIHEPWTAPAEVLDAAGVRLGRTYPRPIVDHREARMRYLAITGELRKPRRFQKA